MILNEKKYGKRVRFAKWLGRINCEVPNIGKIKIHQQLFFLTKTSLIDRLMQTNISIGKSVSKKGAEYIFGGELCEHLSLTMSI